MCAVHLGRLLGRGRFQKIRLQETEVVFDTGQCKGVGRVSPATEETPRGPRLAGMGTASGRE